MHPSIMSREKSSLKAILLLTIASYSLLMQPTNAIQTDDSFIDPDLQCQPLTFDGCKNFGYESTRMPNVFGHQNQDDATKTAIELLLLNNTKCSDEYVFYICQMLFPLCLTRGAHNYDKPILPCRSMCNRVYDSCNSSISEARIILKNEWPQQLECQNLEVENPDVGICNDRNYELYKTKQQQTQHTTTNNHQTSKSNNNQRNKTKLNINLSKSDEPDDATIKSGPNDGSITDDGWGPVRQPFEPPKHPVDDHRDTSPLDVSKLIYPQNTHSTPSNRFSISRSPSSATNEYSPNMNFNDRNINQFNHRTHNSKHNQPGIGEFPLGNNPSQSSDYLNNDPDILTSDHSGLSGYNRTTGTQCDCFCRAPLVPIVDFSDKRYHNRVRVGYLINCAYPCSLKHRTQQHQMQATHHHNSMNIFLSPHQQQTLNTIVSILAWTCFTLTVLTLATFISDIHRFKYPTRCIVFLCACYLLVSLGYILRSSSDSPSVDIETLSALSSSNLSPSMSALQTIIDQQQQQSFYCYQNFAKYPGSGTVQLRCFATFFLTYTFKMAANLWWIIFAIVSFMSSLGWAQESLSTYSQCFHLTAWLIPLIISIVILATESIDGDIQLSMCSVGNLDLGNLQTYIIIPQITALAIGFLFVTIQFVALIRRRNLIRLKNSCDKSSATASISNSPPSSTQISPTGYQTDEGYQGRSSNSKQSLTVNVMKSGGYITTAEDCGRLRYLDKLDGSILRIVLFCLLYFIPMLTLVASLLYDQYSRPIRERQYVCPCSQSNQSSTSSASLSSFGQFLLFNVSFYDMLLAKHVATLSVGIASSLWLLFNMKTLKHWRKIVKRILRCNCSENNDSYNDIMGFDVDKIYNQKTQNLHCHQNKQNYQKQQQLLQQRSIFLPADKNSTIASSRSLVRDSNNIIVNGSQNVTSNHNYHRQLQLLQQQQQRGGLDLADMSHHQTALISSENGSSMKGGTMNQYDEINTLNHSNQMNLSNKQLSYNYRLPSTSIASTSRVDVMANPSISHKQYWMGSGSSHNHHHHHHHTGSQSSSGRGYASSSINNDLSAHNSRRD